MQRSDKKIKELQNAHIRKGPHSSGNRAGLYNGGATPSRICRTRQGFVSCFCMFHLRQQPWTLRYSSRNCKADTAKRSMFLQAYCQPRIRSSQGNLIKNQSQITINLFTFKSKHKCFGWSHAGMLVEWRCIQNAAGCVLYILDEPFSKHAIQTCYTAPRTRLCTGNTGSDTCRYCPHTRSYSGSIST